MLGHPAKSVGEDTMDLRRKDEEVDKKFEELRLLTELVCTFEDARTDLNRAMFDAVEGVSKLDSDGVYVFVNQAYARIAGYSNPEDLVGKPWEATVHPEDLEKMKNAFGDMLEKGWIRARCRGVRKNGDTFHKEVVMRKVENGREFSGHWCFMHELG